MVQETCVQLIPKMSLLGFEETILSGHRDPLGLPRSVETYTPPN